MVAYNFKPRFAAPILAATKRQTIRAHRKRHARPGEEIQLYTGMRTRSCKLLGLVECMEVRPVEIIISRGSAFVGSGISSIILGMPGEDIARIEVSCMEAFALDDGFESLGDMSEFWVREHGLGRFIGVMIRWGDFIIRRAEP